MKKSLVYTRTGDKGFTSLVGGERVPKTHLRLDAYGTVDELNAHLGVLIAVIDEEEKKTLQYVQHCLFTIGAYLATPQKEETENERVCITERAISVLEEAIDCVDAALPPLKSFVLPGGSYPASYCHVCRTVCRRAERCVLMLDEQEGCKVDELVKSFMNRLSDYLFVLSRKLNQKAHQDEIFWDKSCK